MAGGCAGRLDGRTPLVLNLPGPRGNLSGRAAVSVRAAESAITVRRRAGMPTK
jgi:hypothetical protein